MNVDKVNCYLPPQALQEVASNFGIKSNVPVELAITAHALDCSPADPRVTMACQDYRITYMLPARVAALATAAAPES